MKLRRHSLLLVALIALTFLGAVPALAQSKPDGLSVSYGLLLDNSGSMRDDIKYITAAARVIISANTPSDETFIIRFISSDKLEKVQELTRDKATLLTKLRGFEAEGGQSAIIDALYVSAEYLGQKSSDLAVRRSLVIITDGDDRHSYYKLDVLLALLREKQISVYVLGYVSKVKKEEGQKRYEKAVAFLNKLVQESDGKLILVEKAKEIEDKAMDLVNTLHSK
jgi:Ca-activated chloride channel family protein